MYKFHHEFKVVISVPVSFDTQQKEDIMTAGKRAGLEILELIDEPIAAALSSSAVRNGFVIVFGMGAGSCSVAVLRVSGTKIEVLLSVNYFVVHNYHIMLTLLLNPFLSVIASTDQNST